MKQKILFGSLLIILLAVLLILYILHPNTLFIVDTWFHLLLAKQTTIYEIIPLWDHYTFQPFGRTQIYPPLLHIFLGLQHNFLSWEIIMNYTGILYFLAFLVALYCYSSTLWSENIALPIAFAGTLSLITTLTFLSLMPSAIAMIFVILLYLAFFKQHYITASIFIVILLYLHPTIPFLALLGLLYYVLKHKKEQRKDLLKIFITSMICYLPWIIWQLMNISNYNFHRFFYENPLMGYSVISFLSHHEINLIYVPITLWGIYYTRKINNPGLNLTRSLLIGFLPMLIFYGGRYTWHLLPIMYIFPLYAVSTTKIWKNLTGRFKTIPKYISYPQLVLIVSIFLLIPMPMYTSSNTHREQNKTIVQDFTAIGLPIMLADGYFLEDDFQEVLTKINSSPKKTLISANHPDLASALSFFSDHKADYGQYWENSSEDLVEKILKNRETYRPMIFIYKQENIPYPTDNVYTVGKYTIGERL